MGKKFTQFLSTIMVVGMLSGLSGCVESNIAKSSAVENKQDQQSESQSLGYSDWYSSGEQVHKIASALGANNERILSYNPEKNNQPIRLAHKNGEAIEVAFHPNFEEFKPYAVDSLDYLFGIIGEINDNYKYKVVDFVAEHDHDIVFQLGEKSGYAGTTSISSRIADDGVANIEWGIIKIYKEAFKDKDAKQLDLEIRNTITHELMHVLGFDDVYIRETSEHFGNTIINPISQIHANDYAKLHLTPNDYNNLLSLYAKPSKNLDADIERYEAMSKVYEEEYYQNWLASEFEKENPPLESLSKDETYTFSQQCLSLKSSEDIKFSLDVDGDKYIFIVTDKQGSVLEKVSGEVSYLTTDINVKGKQISVKDSVMLIENFESKYLYTNKYYKDRINNSTSTMFLYKSKGKCVLKDAFAYSQNEVVPQNELAMQMG